MQIKCRYALLQIGISILLFGCSGKDNVLPNLVPSEPSNAPNYWCTWYWQNYHIKQWETVTSPDAAKIFTNQAAREELNEEILLGENGWARTMLPNSRSDFFFLIDHGWQDKSIKENPFFSLIMDPNDFPSFAEFSPKDRIKKLNEEITKLGWRGLGLWVRGNPSENDIKRFVEWSKYAGIEYWKIDGGDTEHYYASKIKNEIYPSLTLEHVTGAGPLTPLWEEDDLEVYQSIYNPVIENKASDKILEILKNTDVVRTYDAAPLLVSTTTLQRIHDILIRTAGNDQYQATLNIQDDPNIAAALGLLVAVKRHPLTGARMYEGRDLHFQIAGNRLVGSRLSEMDRMAMWQRIAPPMPAGYGSYKSSDNFLIDKIIFRPGDTWYRRSIGKMVHQSAPAIMVRNIALPTVDIEGDPPYVMASKFPSGSICIATEGRVKPDESWFHPRADISLEVGDAKNLIGVFGHYKSLTLIADHPFENEVKVLAQDLLTTKSIDITDRIVISGNKIVLSGEIIDEIGMSANDTSDISGPGLVIKISK